MLKIINSNMVRKILHMVLALFFIVLAETTSKDTVIYCAFLTSILFAIIRFSGAYSYLGMKNMHVSFGEFFFTFGIVITAIMALPNVKLFELGMTVLAVSDPVAAIFGMNFGKHKYFMFGEKRTFEGSLFCALASFLVFIAFGFSPLFSIISAIILMLVEAVSTRGSDNLFLPIVSVLLFKVFV